MPEVRIAERRLWLGNASRALVSGEVHYWRLDPGTWRDILRQVRRMGLDVISTYVCWAFHECAPGAFDFVGQTNPRRDLLGFLELAEREGFWILLRPGPYIYAEWPNSGIPERVVQYHRLHPEFIDEARTYMAAVVEATRAKLATHAGRIVLWQADNEPDPWLDVYGSQIGLADTPGRFHDFLKDRYAHIAELNSIWQSDFASFDEARAVLQPLPGFTTRYLDVCRFRHWYSTEIVRWTAAEYRRLGIDVPIYANAYANVDVQDWSGLEAACDLAGPDIYPTADFDADPREHRRLLEAGRYTRSYSVLPWVPEFEAGIWHGWHSHVGLLTPNQYPLTALSALQGGFVGWNWYMLASRDNWYLSPITELGRPRPEIAPAFERVVRLFRALDPSGLERVTATSVALSVLHRAARIDDRGEPLLEALAAVDIDYDVWDCATGGPAHSFLLYGAGRWLDVASQNRLAEYVEQGGTLVFFQTLPVLDEAMRPLNVLGLLEPSGIVSATEPHRVALTLGEQSVVFSSPAQFSYSSVPGEPLVMERVAGLPPTQEGGHRHLELPVGERITVGYVRDRGKGRIIVLGVAPLADILVALHAWLDVSIASRALAPDVLTAVLRGDNGTFLIATNNGTQQRDVRLLLGFDVSKPKDLETGAAVPVVDSRTIVIRVAPKDGCVVRLT